MALCGTCHRPIQWLELDGQRVAFDTTPVMRGDNRFAEVGEGLLVRVGPNVDALAYQLHSETCGQGHRV